jgi:hypothetical protein
MHPSDRRNTGQTLPVAALAVQASLLAALVASTFLSEQYYLPIWSLAAVAAAADLRREESERDACAARHQ